MRRGVLQNWPAVFFGLDGLASLQKCLLAALIFGKMDRGAALPIVWRTLIFATSSCWGILNLFRKSHNMALAYE